MATISDARAKVDKALALFLEGMEARKEIEKYGSEHHERDRHTITALRRALQTLDDVAGTPEVQRKGFERQPHGAEMGAFKDTIVEDHESYGTITVSRPTGRFRLVGAMADALPNAITIEIHRAVRQIDTNLHTEHFFGREEIIEVDLSVYQWAEMLSSLNGRATPCTIRRVQGVAMDPVPDEAKTPLEEIASNAREEALKKMVDGEPEFRAAVKKVQDLVSGAKLTKKTQAEILGALQGVESKVSTPIAAAAWASRRVAEDTEKAISQGRVEMAAAFTSIIQKAGMGALAEKLGVSADELRPQLREAKGDE